MFSISLSDTNYFFLEYLIAATIQSLNFISIYYLDKPPRTLALLPNRKIFTRKCTEQSILKILYQTTQKMIIFFVYSDRMHSRKPNVESRVYSINKQHRFLECQFAHSKGGWMIFEFLLCIREWERPPRRPENRVDCFPYSRDSNQSIWESFASNTEQ